MERTGNAISIVPCGAESSTGLDRLSGDLVELLCVPIEIVRPVDLPAGSFNPKRNQHNAAIVLDFLSERFPDCLRIVGVTTRDLFLPIFTHVYGEAQMPGRAAVVSLFRLGPADPAGMERTIRRAVKVAAHEILHTFEITHCRHPECLMQPVTRVDQLDLLPLKLCRSCTNSWEDAKMRLMRLA